MSLLLVLLVLERFKLSDFKFWWESFQLEPGRTLVCPIVVPSTCSTPHTHMAVILLVVLLVVSITIIIVASMKIQQPATQQQQQQQQQQS